MRCGAQAFIRTCDVYLQLTRARLATVDDFHDAIDDFFIETASKPAFHKAHMHQRVGAPKLVTPCWGMGHPPGLQTGQAHRLRLHFAYSLPAHSLSHLSFTRILPAHFLSHTHSHSRSHSVLSHSLTHSLTHALTHSFTSLVPDSITIPHLLAHLLAHSLNNLLTHHLLSTQQVTQAPGGPTEHLSWRQFP